MRPVLLAVAALLTLPTTVHAHDHAAGAHRPGIQIACFRGPWREIIWDRAEVSFTDDLIAAGYSITQAEAIGTRICRDPEGVTNPDHLVATLREILRTERPD